MSIVKKEGKNKALVAWSKDDLSLNDESQGEEVENICLMAKEDEVSSHSILSISNSSLDELHDAFNDLMSEFEKVYL